MMQKFKIIFSSILGNALEFYNLTLHGVFAAVLGNLFFPTENPMVSLMASLGTFAAGFCMRPVGALVFGYIGDRIGRKKALSMSIILMGIPTFCIGLLPTYDAWGIWAPVCLIVARLIQGMCAGGEANGATIFALEHMGKSYPGMVGGLIIGSCLLGSIIAIMVGIMALKPEMPGDAWRWAFIAGGITSLFGIYVRRKIGESPEFKKIDRAHGSPIREAMTLNLKSCGKVFSIAAFDGALTYTLVTFLAIYLQKNLNLPAAQTFYINFVGLISCMLGCPLMGYIADKVGVRRSLTMATLFTFGGALPIFWMILSGQFGFLIVAHIILGLCVASIIGMQPLYSQTLFPSSDRYTGISLSYSLGVGIVGGFTPSILTFLTTYYPIAPAYYLMAFSLGFLILLWKSKP